MAGSTYSTNLKIELMTTGENSGTWGDITNTNLGTALEQAIVGYGNVDYVADANLTISITNSNASQAARALVLNVTSVFGSLTATRELVVPTIQKQYIVQNNTTGGQSITVKTSAGTGITVPNGRKAHLYVDGTNVIQMFDFVDINGGTIDGATVGANSASSGAFTTLTASGATTLNGAVTLGDAAADNITFNGTVTSHLLFTDNTYDIGANGATRPRNLYLAGAATIGGNLSVGGTLTLTGGVNLNGNVTVGDSSSDTLTINSTITSNLIFTDNTYDIGASGATRPRNLFLAGNSTIGGNETVTGTITVDSTTDSSSTTTGSIQTDGGVGIAKKLFVGLDANIYGITVGRGAGAVASNTAVGASALAANTTGANNVAVGSNAGYSNTTGYVTAVGSAAGLSNTTGAISAFGYAVGYANTTGAGNAVFGGYDGSADPTFRYNTTGSYNTAMGFGALAANTTASNNTAVGYQAGYSNTTGSEFLALGYQAAYTNATGTVLTALGYQALYSTNGATQNVAVGHRAGYAVTTGSYNTTVGVNSLRFATTGGYNVAVGGDALFNNTTASNNTAVGYQAGYSNTTGTRLTAVGWSAGRLSTGDYNTFIGSYSGYGHTTGSFNTAVGDYAMGVSTITGIKNTAIGQAAMSSLTSGANNTALGVNTLTSTANGSNNTAIGMESLYSSNSNNNTAVGYQAGYSNTTGASVTLAGYQAGYSNTTASGTTAFGYQAAYSSTTADGIAAFGYNAARVSTGAGNHAFGIEALFSCTTGTNNTAVGYLSGRALTTGSQNTFIGPHVPGVGAAGYAMTTGSKNTIIGGYNGNQGGLDIRTANNYIVLSDGDGNPRLAYNGSGVGFFAAASISTCVFVSGVNQNTLGSYYGDDVDDRSFWINYNGYQDGATRYRTFKVADGKNNSVLTVTGSTHVVKLDYGQLEFPATQNASSNANTLDDYEEGTWTPTLIGSSSTSGQSYTHQRGRYTKIGNLVTISFDVQLSDRGTLSGTAKISGLPFSSTTSPFNYKGLANIGYWSSLNTSYVFVSLTAPDGDSELIIRANTAASANLIDPVATDFFTNATRLIGGATYMVS